MGSKSFQVILANSKTNDFRFTVDGTCIQADPQVKLLGGYVDSRLTCSYQISQICTHVLPDS